MTGKDLNIRVNIHEDICRELNELYARKNADYGNSFGESFEDFGIAMSAIRIGDKFNRLKSFAKNNAMKVTDESLEDTLMDLANYAIMTLIELKIKKEGK